jgi:hypothetical protein
MLISPDRWKTRLKLAADEPIAASRNEKNTHRRDAEAQRRKTKSNPEGAEVAEDAEA